jgi:peptide/nickel transport system permease protein
VLQPPSTAHWLGTNDIGQDVLRGLLVATPNTIAIALATGLLSLLIAGIVAALAATRGRIVSGILLRIVDILQVVPSILLLLLVAAWVQPGIAGTVLLLSLTTWQDDVRVLRAIMVRELTRESIHYARILGARWAYCLWRHVLPAVTPAIVALFVQNVRQAAMRTAGLGFLGLTDPRLATWGSMMQDAIAHLYTDAWLWLLIPPAAMLSLFLFVLLSFGRRLEEQIAANAGRAP